MLVFWKVVFIKLQLLIWGLEIQALIVGANSAEISCDEPSYIMENILSKLQGRDSRKIHG